MRLLPLLALCACNQFYGLDQTQLPPVDALPKDCPPGGRAPKFSRALVQAVTQECTNYHFNVDGSLATAHCDNELYVGSRDEPLVPAGIKNGTDTFYLFARPSATKRRIYIRRTIGSTSTIALVAFDEVNGRWVDAGPTTVPFSLATQRVSTVFRGPVGDRIVVYDTMSKQMFEYEEESTGWMMRGGPYTPPLEYDIFDVQFSITTDGLRAVYHGFDGKQVLYVHRASLDGWFGEAQPLEGAPVVREPHLMEDCTRLYYPGLDSIFFSQQISE